MQDPIASHTVRVLQANAPQLPPTQPRSTLPQDRRAAKNNVAPKPKYKAPNRRSTPHVELAERLRRLRQITRETAQAYLLKIDADLGALIHRLGERTGKSNKAGQLKNSSIKQLLKTARRVDLKPEKGRRKDLRKIEKTVVAMSRIARKN
jgi:hypothetical protein